MLQKIHKIAFITVLVTLFLLPFHAFGTVFLNYGLGITDLFEGKMVINFWKEVVLIFLTLLLILKYFFEKKIPKLDLLDKSILVFFAFGIVHFFLGYVRDFSDIKQLIFGARYDFIFLYALLIIKHFNFNKEEFKKMIKVILIGGGLSLIAGFIIHFLIKPENLTWFGFRNDWSTWYPKSSLAFCQRIEHQELCRMSGTFAGPNQLGAYLVVLIPLITFYKKKISYLFLALAVLALILTFSRAAYIGLIAGLICFIYFKYDLKKYFFKIAGVGITITLVGLIFLFAFDLENILLKPASTLGHLNAWKLGINEIIEHPFGQGLGSSGPASLHLEKPILPENWYLQVGIEVGIIGLILFLEILYLIFKDLIKAKQFRLLAGLTGILLAAIFLHTFDDTPTSLTLFMLLGAAFKQSDNSF